MTEDAYSSSGARRADRETSGTAVGFILFAAFMLIMVGCFQALQGLIAILENEFYVVTRNYLFQFDATTWGWVHLIFGVVVAFAGWGLFSGRSLGPGGGDHRGRAQCHRQLLVDPLVPVLGVDHHHPGRLCHLGAGRPRRGHARRWDLTEPGAVAGKRHDQGRVCGCDRPDGSCAGLVVRRLSRDRVRELAEEIWAASSGLLVPVRPDGDPRSSRPGAAARAAYLRRREQERAVWRPGQPWRWWTVAGAALTVGLVVGATVGERLGWCATVVAAVLAWSRLRFRPSRQRLCLAAAGRAAAPHRRAAATTGAGGLPGACTTSPCRDGRPASSIWWLARPGYGWSSPGGAGGCYLAAAPRPRPSGACAGRAGAVAEGLDGPDRVPVRPLLCVHGRWPASTRSFPGGQAASPRQLAKLVRSGPPLAADQVQRATTRALQLLRPAT